LSDDAFNRYIEKRVTEIPLLPDRFFGAVAGDGDVPLIGAGSGSDAHAKYGLSFLPRG